MNSARIVWGALGLAGLFLALPQSHAQESGELPAQKQGELKTVKERFSYGVGRNIGGNIKAQELDVDVAALAKGIQDALSGAESRVSDEDIQAAVKVVEKEQIAKAKKRREETALKRIEADPELKAQAEKNATAGWEGFR
jgi:FKBP-type peptidyl-prolyl cis-trans isomerase